MFMLTVKTKEGLKPCPESLGSIGLELWLSCQVLPHVWSRFSSQSGGVSSALTGHTQVKSFKTIEPLTSIRPFTTYGEEFQKGKITPMTTELHRNITKRPQMCLNVLVLWELSVSDWRIIAIWPLGPSVWELWTKPHSVKWQFSAYSCIFGVYVSCTRKLTPLNSNKPLINSAYLSEATEPEKVVIWPIPYSLTLVCLASSPATLKCPQLKLTG